MARRTHLEALTTGSRRSTATAMAALLLALTAAAGAATGEPSDDPLSTTLLGRLEPGGEPRLAVRWDGPPGALLDAWVDLDGDGAQGPHDLVVAGRPLEPGIEVVNLEIPTEAYVASEPSVWVQAREPGLARHATDRCLSGRSPTYCAWRPGFSVADLDRTVRAFAVYDDGTGPALYAGGDFKYANGEVVNRVAKWDGSAWSALSIGMDDSVRALAVYDDGTGPALYAGGWFTTAGGVPVNNIAKWDGTGWSALSGPSGTGMNHWVYALAVFDDGSGPALYAGGRFTGAGGVTANCIARWDGTAWSALSIGMDRFVYALAVYDDGSGPALYVGGSFITAGGVWVDSIARWDGSAWSALGSGVHSVEGQRVNALAVFDDGSGPALFAGGYFFSAGDVTAYNIARWDGTAWSDIAGPTGPATNHEVDALAVFDDGSGPALYVGGGFRKAGGATVNYIAKWNGAWSDLPGPSGTGTNDDVKALAVYDDGSGPALYAGGDFNAAGGVPANSIAIWNGAAWSDLPGPPSTGPSASVFALATFDDGSGPALYAGGDFTAASGLTVNSIARWDGSAWSDLSGPSGTGMNGIVLALAVFDDGPGPALYAGGDFTTAGGATVNNIARWDGTAWSALPGPSGTGTDAGVRALAAFDDGSGSALYAGGNFTTAGGVTVKYVARWDGSAWSYLSGPSGTGMNSSVNALTDFDDGSGPALFAGGDFTAAGGLTANYVARWDGTAWSALGPSTTGMGLWVYALAVFDDGSGPALFAGSYVNYIGKWDGSDWSYIFGPPGSMGSPVYALAVYDDGSGPALYAGGSFDTLGAVTANNIGRWDGIGWSPLARPAGNGMNDQVNALAVFDDGSGPALFAGGDFTIAGGLSSSRIATWRCGSDLLFADGFESGDTSGWSETDP